MQSFRLKECKWNSKFTKRTKLQKSTDWQDNLILNYKLHKEIHKLSDIFKKKSKWKITKFKILLSRFKLWEDKLWDLFLLLHKIQTKKSCKSWLDKWSPKVNLKLKIQIRLLLELWLISSVVERMKPWKVNLLALELKCKILEKVQLYLKSIQLKKASWEVVFGI